jgi:acyl transferase domain-containing protein
MFQKHDDFGGGAACNGTNGHGSKDRDVLEPIAIIGISLKFPQDAVSTGSFWKMLLDKRCASTDFPKDRINIEAFHDPNPKKLNTVMRNWRFFLAQGFTDDLLRFPPTQAIS